MNTRIVTGAAVAAAAAALVVSSTFGQQSLIAQTRKGLPMFEVDPRFPQLAEGMVLGAVSGVAADRNGNVWVMQRPHTVPEYNAALNGYKPAPPVIQFDPKGKYLQGWGGYSATGEYDWFYREGELRAGFAECPGCGTAIRGNGDHRAANGEHGIFVDDQDNVWLTGNASRDGQILKFSKDGTFVKQFGKVVAPGSVDSHDTTRFSRAAGVTVNSRTNEAYVSDGYGNRRVIVIDATTGAYKRHWGAYGNPPDDRAKTGRVVSGPGNPQFNTVHGIAISTDGTVYVADRANNRIQAFTPEGTFLKEGYNQRDAKGTGSAFGVVVSPDDKWLYIADAAHEHIAIMDRNTMEVVGSIGRPGHGAGEFTNLHSIAVDRQGNIMTGESQGYRVQKFLYKGLSLSAGLASRVLGAAGPALPEAAAAAISQQLAAAVERGDTPGVTALVVDRDGVLYEGAAGKLDVGRNVPMPVNAIFNIASMTKPITSVAIMMLLEEGKLKLDDPVSQYLTGFDNLQVITKFNDADGTVETRPAKRPMTIRHLMAHTSGIGYGFTSPIVNRLQRSTQKSEWELPLLSDPGDKWNYSASTRVLGLIVEKVTGIPLEPFYQQRIFRPLGMVDTSWAVAADKQSRVASTHSRASGTIQEQPRAPIPSTPTPPFRGDGGLYSTVRDYGMFMRMLLNGGRLGSTRLLTEKSVSMMGENQIGSIFVELQPDADKQRTKPFPLGAGRDKFGLGFQIASKDAGNAKFRSPGSMSWAGIFNTEFWIDPVTHIGGVQMMQVLPFYDERAIRTLRDFEERVYQQLR